MKTKIKAEIVAHSVNEQGDELISVLATFPRIILAEVNTHRMLSKNTSSSRAIPFKKMVETIKNDPFIPIAWQKEHKGMQGTEYITDEIIVNHRKGVWLQARDRAIDSAMQLNGNLTKHRSGTDEGKILEGTGVTKQLCNRLLEPFMWTTMLITGPKSGWDNFFHLRCPDYYIAGDKNAPAGDERVLSFRSKKDCRKKIGNPDRGDDPFYWLERNRGQAEIHMMALAECIWDAYNESTPRQLKAGEWHIPFEDKMTTPFSKTEEIEEAIVTWFPLPEVDNGAKEWIQEQKVKVSVAMAARTSYTVVGEEKEIDYQAMIGLHDRLLAQDPPHSSPLEHCARAMSEDEYRGNIKGKINLINDREFQTKFAAMTGYTPLSGACEEKVLGWCNNFKGFIPYRYIVDNGLNL
jgi:hypothetical protein